MQHKNLTDRPLTLKDFIWIMQTYDLDCRQENKSPSFENFAIYLTEHYL